MHGANPLSNTVASLGILPAEGNIERLLILFVSVLCWGRNVKPSVFWKVGNPEAQRHHRLGSLLLLCNRKDNVT